MSSVYNFICRKCGYEYEVYSGYNSNLSWTVEDIMEKINAGHYGKEIKERFIIEPLTAVDFSNEFYVCECGEHRSGYCLDIYVPKNKEKLLKKELHNKYPGIYAYVKEYEDYKLLKRYEHICKCGKVMKKINYKNYNRCPKCGNSSLMTREIEFD